MEKDKDTLNGFQAFFDTMNPNVGKSDNDKIDLSQNEPLTDEELDAIRNNSKPEDQPKAGKNKEKNQKEEDIEETVPGKARKDGFFEHLSSKPRGKIFFRNRTQRS